MRGESEKWFAQADAITRQVSPLKLLCIVRHSTLHMRSIVFQVAGAANGPLFAHLARRCECSDGAAVNLLRNGGNLFGVLDFSGNGNELPVPPDFDKNAVLKGLVDRNMKVLQGRRCDVHAERLFEMALAEVNLGRLSGPEDPSQVDWCNACVAPRFSVEQGTLLDGRPKLRAVDDETASLVNASTAATTKLHCDRLDQLHRLMTTMASAADIPLSLWKADIDAAYRRVPLIPEHRNFAKVAFMSQEGLRSCVHSHCLHELVFFMFAGVQVFTHNAMPFGAVSSVHHWDRIGAPSLRTSMLSYRFRRTAAAGDLICKIARRALRLPVLRYVDDYYSACPAGIEDQCMRAFARQDYNTSAVYSCFLICMCVVSSGLYAAFLAPTQFRNASWNAVIHLLS